MAPTTAPRSAVRLFAVYAAVSAVAVLVLGLTLAASYRAEAGRRGLGEGAAQAQIVATAAVEPLLDGRDLNGADPGPSPEDAARSVNTLMARRAS